MQLRLKLIDGWTDYSAKYLSSLATYVRDRSAAPGTLQVSTAEYRGQEPLELNRHTLAAMARDMGERSGLSELVESASGNCVFGNWGTAAFRSSKLAHAQFWYLSNGHDVIFATHICEAEADAREIKEAAAIVVTMELVP